MSSLKENQFSGASAINRGLGSDDIFLSHESISLANMFMSAKKTNAIKNVQHRLGCSGLSKAVHLGAFVSG